MAFSLKNWMNKGEGSPTPINAAALKDMETRLSAYTETVVNALVVGSSIIATGAVTAVKIGAEAVEETKIKGEAVSTGKIANLGVTTAKLAELAVTTAKIAENAITTSKLANGAVTDAKIEKPVLCGAVSEAGTITAGTGFTSERTSKGLYKITLTSELPSAGIMIANCGFNGGISATPSSKKVFELSIYRPGSEILENKSFQFVIKVP